MLSVPETRLPHGEPFAADHHKAEEPNQESEAGADEYEPLATFERCGVAPQIASEFDRRKGECETGQALADDDYSVPDMP